MLCAPVSMWAYFFALCAAGIEPDMSATSSAIRSSKSTSSTTQSREQIFDAFRRWGYLQAQLDPLGQYLLPVETPELDFSGPDADEARRYYCSTVGAEFMHIPSAERRNWIAGTAGDGPAGGG